MTRTPEKTPTSQEHDQKMANVDHMRTPEELAEIKKLAEKLEYSMEEAFLGYKEIAILLYDTLRVGEMRKALVSVINEAYSTADAIESVTKMAEIAAEALQHDKPEGD